MPKALLRTGHCMVIAALFFALGGHWLVLQSVAWGTMLVENVETSSLSAALEKTFDGKHPCVICKSIAAAKKQESSLKRTTTVSRLSLYCEQADGRIYRLNEIASAGVRTEGLSMAAREPAVPPPRGIAG